MSTEYVPGLEGIIAARTEISLVDGANGRLVYRGYVIADLAEEMSFEEVAYLLWNGSLPKPAELDALTAELAGSRALTAAARATLEALPADTDPMDVLRSVVSVQGVEHKLQKPTIPLAIHATASFPTILAGFHRQGCGKVRRVRHRRIYRIALRDFLRHVITRFRGAVSWLRGLADFSLVQVLIFVAQCFHPKAWVTPPSARCNPVSYGTHKALVTRNRSDLDNASLPHLQHTGMDGGCRE